MRFWLAIQCAIVLGYFVLALLFWGNLAILFLSMALVPLFVFFRLEHIAMATGIVERGDLRVVSVFLLWIGVLLAVLPYVFTEIYWHAKELLFQPGQTHMFWEFGRIVFVASGVVVVLVASVIPWLKLINRHKGTLTLLSSYNLVVCDLNSAYSLFKTMCVSILAMVLTFGLVTGIAALLVWFGGYTSAEVFDEPSLTLQYQMMIGGFLLSLVPVYFMTHLWRQDALVRALASDAAG